MHEQVVANRIEVLPADERAIVQAWYSARQSRLQTLKATTTFINDAMETLNRALNCDNGCCAGKTREQRLDDCRDLV